MVSHQPVDDVVLVEILKSEDHTAGVEHAAGLREDVVVNVHHKVTTTRVLHHKTHLILSTE